MTETEYHIVLNKPQIMALSYGVIAMSQSITINDDKHDLIILGKKYYQKIMGEKDGKKNK